MLFSLFSLNNHIIQSLYFSFLLPPAKKPAVSIWYQRSMILWRVQMLFCCHVPQKYGELCLIYFISPYLNFQQNLPIFLWQIPATYLYPAQLSIAVHHPLQHWPIGHSLKLSTVRHHTSLSSCERRHIEPSLNCSLKFLGSPNFLLANQGFQILFLNLEDLLSLPRKFLSMIIFGNGTSQHL